MTTLLAQISAETVSSVEEAPKASLPTGQPKKQAPPGMDAGDSQGIKAKSDAPVDPEVAKAKEAEDAKERERR